MAESIYAFAEHPLATEMSLQHIRRLGAGEELNREGYGATPALCGMLVHRDISVVSDRVIQWSRRMREEGRSAPGRVCVACGDIYDERDQ